MTATAADTAAVDTTDLTKTYADVNALDGVSIRLEENRIHGLLGRNGAGKTTLMQALTGQIFATSGQMQVLGEEPLENVGVLSRTVFIQEGQKYPDTFRPIDVLRVAAGTYPNWDQAYADHLVERYGLPLTQRIKKLSRGQFSAIGIVLGLAARAPLTFFDEPYLGLDAVARQMFYDDLLEDFTAHPRTVILSTHHIDEVSDLLEHVVLLDQGRVEISAETEELRSAAIEVSGRLDEVRAFTAGADVLHLQELGALATATIHAEPGGAERARAAGLQVSPVSLQNYIVHRTTAAAAAPVT